MHMHASTAGTRLFRVVDKESENASHWVWIIPRGVSRRNLPQNVGQFGNRSGNLKRRQNLQRLMTDFAEIAVDHMSAWQEWQHGRPAQRQALERHFQSPVVRRVVQPSRENVCCILVSVRADIHLPES